MVTHVALLLLPRLRHVFPHTLYIFLLAILFIFNISSNTCLLPSFTFFSSFLVITLSLLPLSSITLDLLFRHFGIIGLITPPPSIITSSPSSPTDVAFRLLAISMRRAAPFAEEVRLRHCHYFIITLCFRAARRFFHYFSAFIAATIMSLPSLSPAITLVIIRCRQAVST